MRKTRLTMTIGVALLGTLTLSACYDGRDRPGYPGDRPHHWHHRDRDRDGQ